MREYKSGSTWAFWRYSQADSGYIRRLHLIKTPWFAICLHWLYKPDPEPYVHDHPVSFLSLILRGGYTEMRLKDDNTIGLYKHRWYNFIRSSTKHSIVEVLPGTVTLALMGPKTQEWGFFKVDSLFDKPCISTVYKTKKILWKQYYAAKRKGEQL